MTSIYIYNRIDPTYGWDSRLKDVFLEVYDGSIIVYQEDLAVNDKWDNSLVTTTFDSPIVGNRVRLQKYGLDNDEHNLLNIWEVEVYARPVESKENIALGGVASQSCNNPGDAYNRLAPKGIDGVNAGVDSFTSASDLDHMFVTCHQDNAWWEVQLHTRAVMTSIYIYNRIDPTYGWDSRLKDVYLQVYDGTTRVYQEDLAVNDKWDNSLVTTTFDSPIVGDRVRLQKYGLNNDEHNLLNIWEVEVYGSLE